MFPLRFFTNWYFAPTYWPEHATPATTPRTWPTRIGATTLATAGRPDPAQTELIPESY